jgi:hypothetical protein
VDIAYSIVGGSGNGRSTRSKSVDDGIRDTRPLIISTGDFSLAGHGRVRSTPRYCRDIEHADHMAQA